jgi:hypothetical protein
MVGRGAGKCSIAVADAVHRLVWNSGCSLTSHQPSPPASLASILDSFRRSGEGDRDLLLSILGAKKAEEEVSEHDLSHSTHHSSVMWYSVGLVLL